MCKVSRRICRPAIAGAEVYKRAIVDCELLNVRRQLRDRFTDQRFYFVVQPILTNRIPDIFFRHIFAPFFAAFFGRPRLRPRGWPARSDSGICQTCPNRRALGKRGCPSSLSHTLTLAGLTPRTSAVSAVVSIRSSFCFAMRRKSNGAVGIRLYCY